MRNWTWLVLVASGGLAWACGGDDDGGGNNGSTGGTGGETTGSGGSGGGGEPTIEELCEAECTKQVAVGCDMQTDVDTCITDSCLYFYNPNCEAQWRAFWECDSAAPVEEFTCYSGYPTAATSCYDLFDLVFCE